MAMKTIVTVNAQTNIYYDDDLDALATWRKKHAHREVHEQVMDTLHEISFGTMQLGSYIMVRCRVCKETSEICEIG